MRSNRKWKRGKPNRRRRRRQPPSRKQRSEYISGVLDKFFKAYHADKESSGDDGGQLSRAALKSVLVIALHQLTATRFSSDRLFAEVGQAVEFLQRRVRVAERASEGGDGSGELPIKRPFIPVKEKMFLSDLVDDALAKFAQGQLKPALESYPQLRVTFKPEVSHENE